MKNKILMKIIIFVVLLSLMFINIVQAIQFSDIISTYWAKDSIEKMASLGIVTGYADKTFKPEGKVNVLESLVMISRIYKIDENLQQSILAKHEAALKKMPNTEYNEWSFKPLAIIIELGVVSSSGIEDMFSKKTIFNSAKREEIAILLTKAMMLGDEAQSLKTYSLPFSDADKISTVARPYVYMMYSNKIFQGDNNKNINPANSITRAEITTLMDKAHSYITSNNVTPDIDGYNNTRIITGYITDFSVNTTDPYIVVVDDSNEKTKIKIDNLTKIYSNGSVVSISSISKNIQAISKINETGYAQSIELDKSKQVNSGTIRLIISNEPSYITFVNEAGEAKTYYIPSTTNIFLDGIKVTLKDLKENDKIMLHISNNEIYKVSSFGKTKIYEGEISSIDYTYPVKITLLTNQGTTKTFTYNSKVTITNNSTSYSFDSLRAKDQVKISTEFDELVAINKTSTKAEVSGLIKEIIIGETNKLKIADKDGAVTEYNMSNNAVITIGSKNATVYDLRLGYNIDINTYGKEIVTITASEIAAARNFSGKIIFINNEKNLIMISNIKESGQTELIYLKVTNSTKIFNILGETKYFSSLAEGSAILSSAVYQNGEYLAASILIQ